MLSFFVFALIGLPIFGFLLSLTINSKQETKISTSALILMATHMLLVLLVTAIWALQGMHSIDFRLHPFYEKDGYEFVVHYTFDGIAAVFLCVSSLLTFLVVRYSQFYMHREEGFKRFFNAILLFYIGVNQTLLAGNFETLFMGWEVLGLSSFLLITFYRDRYLPVKNAVKIFSIYRIGDVGLLLAIWLSHHLFHQEVLFRELNELVPMNHQLGNHWVGGVLAAMLLLTAMCKSAQMPFSTWLPRAMEGPTPSSAIFYGALSVHMGVFLLLRTSPLWMDQFFIRCLMGVVGLITALMATSMARVQSSIKSQIAYASICQIGLMFIELALGLLPLVLFHFAGNAFLRTYQLLVSPSVVTYLIREQFFAQPKVHGAHVLMNRWQSTLYSLSLKEWDLDGAMYRYLWHPLKWFGALINKMSVLTSMVCLGLLLGLISWCRLANVDQAGEFNAFMAVVIALLAFSMSLKSFSERQNVMLSWVLLVMTHVLVLLAVSFNERFSMTEIVMYLGGVILAFLIGLYVLRRLQVQEGKHAIDLDQFHGLSQKHPKLTHVFLFCCLALYGFPISPSFIGEDLLFNHIELNQIGFAFLIALTFIVNGLACIRIFARLFLGPVPFDRRSARRSA